MSGATPARRAASITAIALLVTALVLPTTDRTDAAWRDREQIGSTFAAMTVPKPGVSACTTATGALGVNQVTLNWRIPAGVSNFTKDAAEFGQKTGTGAYTAISTSTVSTIATTGTTAAYATQIAGTPLHATTAGTSKTFGIRLSVGGWKSEWVDACTFAAVRSRILPSQISVTASSEEVIAENDAASRVNDDDASTNWVNRWATQPTTTYPHTLLFDLGKAQSVDGLGYLSRNNSNAAIKNYTIEVSTDGRTYTQVASGTWIFAVTWQNVDFTARSARYVRLTATSSTAGTTFAAAAEVAIFGTPTP